MSKVLLKRRVPWPSGLILAGAPQHLLRLPPCPEFPVWRVARGGTGQVSGCQSDPPTAAQSIAAGRPALPHTHFHAGRRCLSAGWANSKLGRPVQKVGPGSGWYDWYDFRSSSGGPHRYCASTMIRRHNCRIRAIRRVWPHPQPCVFMLSLNYFRT